jgi:hypothetical protein
MVSGVMPSARASVSAVASAWGVLPATAAVAPAKSAPAAVTVISGCSEKACGWDLSGASVVAPEQWPTSRPGRGAIAAAAFAIAASGTASRTTLASGAVAPRPRGPSTGTPAARSAAASAVPRRP